MLQKLHSKLDHSSLRICERCIYDERVPSIQFNNEGVCNYCLQVESLQKQYCTGQPAGDAMLAEIVAKVKKDGLGKKYDCVIGVSGGTDSSYMAYLLTQWGLRPLAVHYDNTWNSAIATQNISKVLKGLGIDLYTHVVDNKEADDLVMSFLLADVAEIEAPTDLALAEVMYRAAYKNGVKYIFEGHSFVTEGITPVGRNYFDGKYIQSIHRAFGRRPMNTYPLMTFNRFLWWVAVARIKKIRPFWYIQYSKEDARNFLEREFGWTYYGGHHLENRLTAFFHGIYAPWKFDQDFRNNTLSALARNGKMSREEAWEAYTLPPFIEGELASYFRKRLGLSEEAFEQIMSRPPKSWHEYPTYKGRFEKLRPLFAILAKANLVPMSFYLKYCFPAGK